MKMPVEDLTIEELKEIKAQLEKGEKFDSIAFLERIVKGEYDALMDRLTKEVGYKKDDKRDDE